MNFLEGKKVVLGVTAGIAAYKSLNLVRELRKAGAEVHVIMTEHATNLVAPLLFRELSGNPVTVDMWAKVTNWNVTHIALATLADVFLVAPATVNIIGKIANGIADDMLSTTVTATKAPVVIVPAMNTNMYENPIVQQNMAKLREVGYTILEPSDGELACGTSGKGRFPEESEIVFHVERILSEQLLKGKKVVVTAGGTREAIDPVRFIGNRSSGKMGYALAKVAAMQGADVTLVSATNVLEDPWGVKVLHVTSANEMKNAVDELFDDCDVVIKAAAVADYRPEQSAAHKIKKSSDNLQINLVNNPDILFELGQKKKKQVLVGFAAETQNLIEYATAKLKKKNLDLLVANNVAMPGAGFNTETNIVTLLYRDGSTEEQTIMSKAEVADIVVKRVAKICETLHK